VVVDVVLVDVEVVVEVVWVTMTAGLGEPGAPRTPREQEDDGCSAPDIRLASVYRVQIPATG
jgi:hypothetical protein